MKRSQSVSLCVAVSAALLVWSGTPSDALVERVEEARLPAAFELPPASEEGVAARFVANHGQWDPRVLYRAQFGDTTVFLEPDGWSAAHIAGDVGASVQIRFVTDREPEATSGARGAGVHNYFVGERSRWRTSVPQFEDVRYEGIHDGIDVRAYELDGHFEFDVELEPGADLSLVEFEVRGAGPLHATRDGGLSFHTAAGEARLTPPTTWEMASGARRQVASRYVVRGPSRFGFEVPDWDGERPLVVDPGLLYGSYLGGSAGEQQTDVAVLERDGIITVAGSSISLDYPTTAGAFQSARSTFHDIVVTQMDPSLPAANQLLYSTYIGGNSVEWAVGVDVNAAGRITVAGTTRSLAFPTTANAYDRTFNGLAEVFVCILDPGISGLGQLVYSTYLGGSDEDIAKDMFVDRTGLLHLVGSTASSTFPTTFITYDSSFNGGSDGFYIQLDAGAPFAQIRYGTFFGGPGDDSINAVELDISQAAVLAGDSDSGLPITPTAWNPGLSSGMFLAVMDPSLGIGKQLLYNTYFGSGALTDSLVALSVTPDGNIALVGNTKSQLFPVTPGAWKPIGGGTDCFLAIADPTLPGAAAGLYSTYLDEFAAHDVFFDRARVVTVATNRYLLRLDPFRAPAEQEFCRYSFGDVRSMSVDDRGHVTAVAFNGTGVTPNAYQSSQNGGGDMLVVQSDMLPRGVAHAGASSAGCAGIVATGATWLPDIGGGRFSIYAYGTQPTVPGAMLIGAGVSPVPLPVLGVDLWLDFGLPVLAVPLASSSLGSVEVPIGIPANPGLVGSVFACQFVFAEATAPAPCPVAGLSASDAIVVTVQP